MRFRSGQVAIYLVLALVALTILVLMNVGAYLSVTAKNLTMNAGDAAAVAAADYQGFLLNRIGRMNVDHLEAAIRNDLAECTEIERRQLRASFLGPIDGSAVDGGDSSLAYGCISAAERAARERGAKENDGMRKLLADHALEIVSDYVPNPLLYPPPWEGAWEEYAAHLQAAVSGGVSVGPDNIDYMDAANDHLLINQQFYNAIAGRCWCWFNFYARGELETGGAFADWPMLETGDDETRRRKSVNSEIYSLHLMTRRNSAVTLLGRPLILKLLNDYGSRKYTMEDLMRSHVITNREQTWFFYDNAHWRKWWEIDPNGDWQFPVRGKVMPKYDVRGCAAVCRVISEPIPDLIGDEVRETSWSAAAKPFGCLVNSHGDEEPVTDDEFRRLVLPSFTEARLVPLDAAGGREPGFPSSDPVWADHVRKHLKDYMETGILRSDACWYCRQLQTWSMPVFHGEGRNWLSLHGHECVRPTGGGTWRGGTPHGH